MLSLRVGECISSLSAAFESYAEEMVVDGKPISLALWDTVDSTESDQRLRPLGYPDTNVFVICFSLDSPSSLEHVESKVCRFHSLYIYLSMC